jgi:hypothetical protein
MLDKEPAIRPGAIEVRQVARAIAFELTSAYAEMEITGGDHERPRVPQAMIRSRMAALPAPTPSDEVVVVDPESLEFGTTEMLPVVRKPRWTPQIGAVSNDVAARSNERARIIGPKSARDQVAGEIHSLDKRRH